MTKIFLALPLAIFTTFFGCSRLPLVSTIDQTNRQPLQPETVTLRTNKTDLLYAIPSSGLPLCNAVLKIRSASASPTTPPTISDINVVDTGTTQGGIVALMRELYNEAKKAVPSTDLMKAREANELEQELIRVFNPKTVPTDDLIRSVLNLASSPNVEEADLDNKLNEMLTSFIEKSELQFVAEDSSTPASTVSELESVDVVRMIRKTGDEIVIPVSYLHNTQIGSVLLANGDIVSIEGIELFSSDGTQSRESVTVLDRDNSTILASLNASELSSQTVNTVWQKYIFPRGNPYDTVVTVGRNLPNGRVRYFIIPLPLDGNSADSDRRIAIMDMHKLAPGDSVHVGTLELLPIVFGSKIISRRLQMAALQEEHEIEQMESYEKHQRIKAFRQKMQANHEGNMLGKPQQWFRSASNRLADGVGVIRDTINLP